MCAGIFNTFSEVFSRLLDPESPLLLGRLTTPPTIRERLTRPLPGVRGYSKRSAALSSYSLHNVISGNRASARPIWPSFRPCVYHGRTTEQHQGAAHAVVNAACAAKYDGWSHESGETICRELGGRRKRLPAYSNPSRPLIPTQVGHPFRRNAATDSEPKSATFSSLLGIGGRHPSE